jgi:RND family efflux transporter MFP subunit
MIVVKAELTGAQAKLEASEIDVREATADRKVAMADVARAEVFVNYTRIVAPWDGIVTKRACNEGDFVRSGELVGSTPILTVVKTAKVRVIVEVGDNLVPYLDRGDPVEIRFHALRPRVYRGSVTRIAEAEEVERMRAEIDLDNADGRLKSGQRGEATIQLEKKQGVRAIPVSAIRGRNAGDRDHAICYRIENNRAVRARIKIGIDDGVRIEVIDGLEEGDRVITHTDGELTDGQEVIVKEASELLKNVRSR